MKKRTIFIVFIIIFVYILIRYWNGTKVELLKLIAWGLILDIVGVIFLALDRYTKKQFEDYRKQSRVLGDFSDEKLNRMIYQQYKLGIPLIILGFLLQLASVIIQIYNS